MEKLPSSVFLVRQVRPGPVPTVWLYGRRYSSAHLSNHPELVGTTLRLRPPTADDVAQVECLTEDGQELPPLELLTESKGRRMPAPTERGHITRSTRLGMTYSEDPIDVYLKYAAARKAVTARDPT